MLNSYEIKELIEQITRTRGLERDFVVKSLSESLASAIQRSYGDPNYPVEVNIESKTGKIDIKVQKKVVKKVIDPRYEISLEEAKSHYPLSVEGIDISVPVNSNDFLQIVGRGSIQRMRQIFLQKIQEAEKQHIYKDFQDRIGDIVNGMVQKVYKSGVYVALGKVEAFLPPEEQIRKERYRTGQNIKALIIDVDTRGRRPLVKLSRTHPDFLAKLMELEIPELMEGIIEIKGVARYPGERAKVAVYSRDENVDPLGACVGIKGTRIRTVTKELSEERIDVIKWEPDIKDYAMRALSPGHPVNIYEDGERLVAVIPDEEIRIAKGVASQNVILASRLIAREIWVISRSEHEGKKQVPIADLELDEETKLHLKKEVDGVYSLEELIGRLKALHLIQENDISNIEEANKKLFKEVHSA